MGERAARRDFGRRYLDLEELFKRNRRRHARDGAFILVPDLESIYSVTALPPSNTWAFALGPAAECDADFGVALGTYSRVTASFGWTNGGYAAAGDDPANSIGTSDDFDWLEANDLLGGSDFAQAYGAYAWAQTFFGQAFGTYSMVTGGDAQMGQSFGPYSAVGPVRGSAYCGGDPFNDDGYDTRDPGVGDVAWDFAQAYGAYAWAHAYFAQAFGPNTSAWQEYAQVFGHDQASQHAHSFIVGFPDDGGFSGGAYGGQDEPQIEAWRDPDTGESTVEFHADHFVINSPAVTTRTGGSSAGGHSEYTKTAQTTTATPLHESIFTLDTNETATVEVKVAASRSDVVATVAGFTIQAAVTNVGSSRVVGTPTIDGWADAAAATWDVNIEVASNVVKVVLTGQAAKTIEWVVNLTAARIGA